MFNYDSKLAASVQRDYQEDAASYRLAKEAGMHSTNWKTVATAIVSLAIVIVSSGLL